jgi:hypothetical protein
MLKTHCLLLVSSIPARKPSSLGTPHRTSSVITDLRDSMCQIRSLRLSGRCSCMAPRAASATSSSARGTVLSAISVQKLHRVGLCWAFTRSCDFRAIRRSHRSSNFCSGNLDHYELVGSVWGPAGIIRSVIKCGCAFVHAVASCFVSKNRSITIALSWLAVRPHKRAALRLTTAGPVSTAMQVRSGKITLLPYGIRFGSTAQCPECSRRPVLAYLSPSPAQ